MAVTQGDRSWEHLLAARTRAGVGGGLEAILALAGDTALISFAGGFPDPQTFPTEKAALLLAEMADSGESAAFQRDVDLDEQCVAIVGILLERPLEPLVGFHQRLASDGALCRKSGALCIRLGFVSRTSVFKCFAWGARRQK